MHWILVPIDFSSCAPLLIQEAIRFAKAFECGMILLHVSDSPRGVPLTARIQPPGLDHSVTVAEWLRKDAEQQMKRLSKSIPGVVRVCIEMGHPVEQILTVAAREGVQMVVMGTHGRTGTSRLMVGSVAEEVLRHANVPVVTVRTQHRPDCPAASCAACSHNKSEHELALMAETEG